MYINKNIVDKKIISAFLSLFILCSNFLQADDLTNHQKAAQELEKHNYHRSNYYYFKILSKQPDNIEALTGLAHSLQMQGRNDRALIEVNKLLNIDPDNEQGLLLRAFSNTQKQNWDGILDDMQHLVQINPLNEYAYAYMDTAYSALGDKDAAESAKERHEQVKAAVK